MFLIVRCCADLGAFCTLWVVPGPYLATVGAVGRRLIERTVARVCWTPMLMLSSESGSKMEMYA
jgi:hypothetical protein